MDMDVDVIGLLLAGGRSSRMGGGDKCLRSLASRPILSHIIERLKPQVGRMVLNANGDPSRFSAFGLPVVADSIAGFAGPLAGVHAGLEWARTSVPAASHVVTAATDTPFFPTDLVTRLFAASHDLSASLVVARSDEGVHPVIGLWPVALAPLIEDFLKQGMRKVGAFAKQQGAVEVYFPRVEVGGTSIDPFFNINQPEELACADALLREQTL
jgi:molybdopterin-guanine dinucleotide biosynthesis protein A